jgi:uncharacterized protein YoxC
MFGFESDEIERSKPQRQAQYARELRQQIEHQRGGRPLPAAGQQIAGVGAPPIPDPAPQRLDFLVERAVALEVPTRLRPCQDAINALSGQFERLVDQTQSTVNSLRDKVSEMSASVSSLGDRFADSRDRMQDFMGAAQRENAKLREQNEAAAWRIQQLESKCVQIEEFMLNANRRQQQLEESAAEQVGRLSAGVASARSEAGERDRQIMGEVELLNQQAQAALGQVGQQVQALSSVLAESVAQLAASTRSAIDTVRAEHESDFARLAEQLEKSTAEAGEGVGRLEGELLRISNAFSGAYQAADGAICAENTARVIFEQKVVEGFQTVTEQLANGMKSIDSLQADVQGQMGSLFASYRSDIAAFMKDIAMSVSDCKARTMHVEQRLSEYIIANGKRQDEIFGRLERFPAPNEREERSAPQENDCGRQGLQPEAQPQPPRQLGVQRPLGYRGAVRPPRVPGRPRAEHDAPAPPPTEPDAEADPDQQPPAHAQFDAQPQPPRRPAPTPPREPDQGPAPTPPRGPDQGPAPTPPRDPPHPRIPPDESEQRSTRPDAGTGTASEFLRLLGDDEPSMLDGPFADDVIVPPQRRRGGGRGPASRNKRGK